MRVIFCFFLLSISTFLAAETLVPAKKIAKLMGCRFEITAIATNDNLAWQAVEKGIAEIQRIEKLISSWDENSQTSLINATAAKAPVQVDQELFDLIYRAKKVAKLTHGAFDISFAAMDRIWTFDKTTQILPDSNIVANARAKVNWENISLDVDKKTVFFQQEGMKIGFGAIGKGYAANQAKKVMEQMTGVKGGLVNASGDLITWGKNTNDDYWKIQLADPNDKTKSLGWLALKNNAMVTSGDYEKYFMADGKRYAHIINPKTGYPTTGVKSVSIICPDTELADALATSIFVLGVEKGLALINQLNQVEALIITDDNAIQQSNNLKLNTNK